MNDFTYNLAKLTKNIVFSCKLAPIAILVFRKLGLERVSIRTQLKNCFCVQEGHYFLFQCFLQGWSSKSILAVEVYGHRRKWVDCDVQGGWVGVISKHHPRRVGGSGVVIASNRALSEALFPSLRSRCRGRMYPQPSAGH